MVSMRLKRFGSKRDPYYRLVVIDKKESRQSSTIEELGQYRPCLKENQIVLKEDRIKDWLQKGAVPSDTVKKLLNKNGITISRSK